MVDVRVTCPQCGKSAIRAVAANHAMSVIYCSQRCSDRAGCQAWRARNPSKPKIPPLKSRILAKLAFDRETGCLLWTGTTSKGGYGQMRVGRRFPMAHRVVYEMWAGPIPESLELDHTCNVPACCNPDHLEPVTHGENMRRMRARLQK
jgi:endogenous inhibitor of DNA gyrase (YacG/DUF329 family)